MPDVSFQLHSPSILVAGGLAGLLGCVLLARSRVPSAEEEVSTVRGVWLAAAFTATVVCLVNAARDWLPPWIIFQPLNALHLTALALLWLGARRSLGYRSPNWWAALPATIWLAAQATAGFEPLIVTRLLVFFPSACALLVMAAIHLFALYQRDGLCAARDLAFVLAVFAAWLCGIILASFSALPPPTDSWGFVRPPTATLIAVFTAVLPLLMLSTAREQEFLHEAKRRHAALEEGRAEIARLHEHLPAVIYLRSVGPHGDMRTLYRGGDITGVTGLPISDTHADLLPVSVPHEHVFPFEEHLAAVRRDGAASLVWHLPQLDGGYRVLRTSSRLLRSLPEGGVEVVGHTIDITAETVANARAMATARLASVGEMGAGLAHEIKQPLQAISLAAEIALLAIHRADTFTVAQRLDLIVEQAANAANTVEQLRRFASRSSAAPSAMPLKIQAPVAAALRLTRHALDEAGVTVESGEVAPLVVRGNEIAMTQVLVHLIANAREAMEELPPHRPRRLRILTGVSKPGWAEVSVADTGGGIAPEILSRLFEPFVSTKGPDRGQGISLAASYGLVRSMQGTLTAHSGPEGAVFVIALPMASGGPAASP